MTSIVTDMLNLGRLDMGKLEVQKESVELESIIKDQIELLRYVASNKNVYPIHEVKLPVRI
jgi:signal transduction histidine kinase